MCQDSYFHRHKAVSYCEASIISVADIVKNAWLGIAATGKYAVTWWLNIMWALALFPLHCKEKQCVRPVLRATVQ